MDPILAALPPSLLAFVEERLSNDEVSSGEEMLEHFIDSGLTEQQARQALTYRDRYLNNLYLKGFTPIYEGPRRFASTPTPENSSRNSPHHSIPSGQLLPLRVMLLPSTEDKPIPAAETTIASSSLSRLQNRPQLTAAGCRLHSPNRGAVPGWAVPSSQYTGANPMNSQRPNGGSRTTLFPIGALIFSASVDRLMRE